MPCEYCGRYGSHNPRCPLYEPPKVSHYCSICQEGILNGEEYIENDCEEYAHWECVNNAYELLDFLNLKRRIMEE